MLAALARETSRVRLGTLVTGVTYRNPALLAKTRRRSTSSRVAGRSSGSVPPGTSVEHEGYGFEFPPVRERMDRLDEALTIVARDVHRGPAVVRGRHYRIERGAQRAATDPAGRTADPGRRWRRAADAADRGEARRHDPLVPARPRCAPPQDRGPRRGYCAEIGRDPATIERTMARRSSSPATRPRRQRLPRAHAGGTPAVHQGRHAEQMADAIRPYLDAGFTGFTFNNSIYRTPEQIGRDRRAAEARRLGGAGRRPLTAARGGAGAAAGSPFSGTRLCDSSAVPTDETLDRVDAVFAKFVAENGAPGVAYGLIDGGDLIRAGGHGEARLGDASPPGADTIFRIASMTKSFTASMVLLLRDKGRLGLDDEVVKYVPEVAGIRRWSADSPPLVDPAAVDDDRRLPERRSVGRSAAGSRSRATSRGSSRAGSRSPGRRLRGSSTRTSASRSSGG